MHVPNMDTRRIKRLDNGHFTVEPLSSLQDPKSLICNHCAIAKCKLRNYVRRVPHDQAVLKVTSCGMFLPTLGFSVLAGLDQDYWNTVRVGGAWAQRLYPGRQVAVADTKNGEIVGTATVVRTHSDRLGDLLKEHARFNHAILAEIEDGKIEESDAPARLLRILKNANGSNIADENRMASAVYLRRE